MDSSDTTASRLDYLRTVAFPLAASRGAFGAGAEFASFYVDEDVTVGDQFASDIVFGTVAVTGAAAGGGPVDVVVKFKNADPAMSAMMNMHQKFYNEYVFYARLLPELVAHATDPAAAMALFPRFLYSNATPDGGGGGGDMSAKQPQVIVLASLASAGYRPAVQRLFLDVEHALLAVRKLGALHGLSYATKAVVGPRRFATFCTASLAETQWFDGHWFKSPRFLSGTYNSRTGWFTRRWYQGKRALVSNIYVFRFSGDQKKKKTVFILFFFTE